MILKGNNYENEETYFIGAYGGCYVLRYVHGLRQERG